MKHEKHPHVRGENPFLHNLLLVVPETPPRAWGKLDFLFNALLDIGNTPTCVGKTYAMCSPLCSP